MNEKSVNPDLQRRQFLGRALTTGAAATLVPGAMLLELAQAKAPDAEATNAVRWGMLVDTTKCTDCGDCVKACDAEHGLAVEHESRPLSDARWIRMVQIEQKATKKVTSLPLMCQHCETPPCVDVCPTGASFKRADNIVLVDKHICIGCRYCMMACPYKARSFVHEVIENQVANAPRGKGTVEACTFCVDRVDAGNDPACVDACKDKALLFGDLKDAASDIAIALKSGQSSAIREDLGLNPGVRYKGI